MNYKLNIKESTTTQILKLIKPTGVMPVILCIGSDRVIYDALGPLTGELLTSRFFTPAFVYGTLSRPVNALNLTAVCAYIAEKHRGAQVIAVDASLGSKSDIGKICVIRGGILAGAADNKKLPRAGDIGLTATVAEYGKNTTSPVRLGFVNELSVILAQSIHNVTQIIKNGQAANCEQNNTVPLLL